MHRGPQVQGVALGAAVGVEALEDVLAQVGRKDRLRVTGLAVDRARPAALQATAAQLVEAPQVAQDLFQGLRRILCDMETADPAPESFRVIRALERMKNSQARELLTVIGEGPSGLRSTREAKKALDRVEKGKPTP